MPPSRRAALDRPTTPPPPSADDLVAARELWPIREAARRLSVHHATLYRERERGRLEIVRIGRRTYVTDKELRRYVAALERDERAS